VADISPLPARHSNSRIGGKWSPNFEWSRSIVNAAMPSQRGAKPTPPISTRPPLRVPRDRLAAVEHPCRGRRRDANEQSKRKATGAAPWQPLRDTKRLGLTSSA